MGTAQPRVRKFYFASQASRVLRLGGVQTTITFYNEFEHEDPDYALDAIRQKHLAACQGWSVETKKISYIAYKSKVDSHNDEIAAFKAK